MFINFDALNLGENCRSGTFTGPQVAHLCGSISFFMKILQIYITLYSFKKLYSRVNKTSPILASPKVTSGAFSFFFLKTLIYFLLLKYAISMMKQSLKTPFDMKFTFQYLK